MSFEFLNKLNTDFKFGLSGDFGKPFQFFNNFTFNPLNTIFNTNFIQEAVQSGPLFNFNDNSTSYSSNYIFDYDLIFNNSFNTNTNAFKLPEIKFNVSDIKLPKFDSFEYANRWNTWQPLMTFHDVKATGKQTEKQTGKQTNSTWANGTHEYAYLSRKDALLKAQNDDNLEELSSGQGWKISDSCFKNDIPFARKGTAELLDKVCEKTGANLTITSALGTKNSPHSKGKSECSHYSEENPKLDIGGGLTYGQAVKLCSKLKNTGLFARAEVERHSDGTAHLDVQFSKEAYESLA